MFMCAKGADYGLVVTDHGAQRAGNQMQLVLNNQVGRKRSPVRVEPEEASRFGIPRKQSKFVHRSDQERRTLFINRFIDDMKRQSVMKITIRVVTCEFD